MSLKALSAEGCGEVASTVPSVGASDPGLKGFQGLDGQWKGLSFTALSGEADGLDVEVSSSEDSSLTEAWVGDDTVEGGTSIRKFLSGDQPGGRRLIST